VTGIDALISLARREPGPIQSFVGTKFFENGQCAVEPFAIVDTRDAPDERGIV